MAIVCRPYGSDDADRVKALHASQKLDYPLPDLEAEQFLVRCVLEEDGIVTAAAFLRKVANAYYIADPANGSKREKLGKLFILRRELTAAAQRAGFNEVEAFVPPDMEKFGNLLTRLGWKKNFWPCYSIDL
jgi:hypothetical protein